MCWSELFTVTGVVLGALLLAEHVVCDGLVRRRLMRTLGSASWRGGIEAHHTRVLIIEVDAHVVGVAIDKVS